MDINQIRDNAKSLREKGNYREALEPFRILWEDHRNQCNEWDGWGYAYCLRKTGQSEGALDVCREVYKIKPDFDHVKNLYSWCIYDLEIKKEQEEIEKNQKQFFKAAEAILGLSSQEDKYSPFTRTIFAVLDLLKAKQSYPAEKILEWLNRLDESKLSDENVGKDGKSYASDREKWLSYRCKALLHVKQYQECIDVGLSALQHIDKFHYDNDIWIKRYIAKSKYHLGNYQEAINLFEDILSRKQDWFILKEIALCYIGLDDQETAKNFLIEAAITKGGLGFKWEIFLLLGELFKADNQNVKAKKLISLSKKIRENQGWDIPKELAQAVSSLEIENVSEINTKQLYKELCSEWKKEKLSKLPIKTGWVNNILPNGKAGFISGDDGNDYYFRLDEFQAKSETIKEDLKVEFHVQENPNPDQNDNAVNIEIIALDNIPQIKGVVSMLGDSFGFIQADNGEDYYFQPHCYLGDPEDLSHGLRVEFYIKKNNKPDKGDIAVRINSESVE
jgi:cold shock CspA family protein/tetratricopeptide (TPR) repeat protein